MEREHEQLVNALRVDSLDGLGRLDATEADHLAKAIDAVVLAEGHALAEAGEAALEHVPRLFRGAVRKVLFG